MNDNPLPDRKSLTTIDKHSEVNLPIIVQA